MKEISVKQKHHFETVLGLNFVEGNRITILQNGDEIFPSMLSAIENAEQTVEFLTYVYWKGPAAEKFARLFSQKAKEGLKVKVLLDAFGAAKIDKSFVRMMEDSGVELRWFRPFSTLKLWKFDNRTHRKILVCDDSVGFTGGVGIAEEWEGNAQGPGQWRDTHFKVEGPAVAGLSGAFWDNWSETQQGPIADLHRAPPPPAVKQGAAVMVVRSGPQDLGSDAVNLIHAAVDLAEESILITTPYLVLDDYWEQFLANKARRGTQISIMLPGKHLDKRFEFAAAERSFGRLIHGGVKIYRYEKTMLHQKVVLIDDRFSLVGSMNFNQRSMRRDSEIIMAVKSPAINRQLREAFDADLEDCVQERAGTWRKRPLRKRVYEKFVRAFKGQM